MKNLINKTLKAVMFTAYFFGLLVLAALVAVVVLKCFGLVSGVALSSAILFAFGYGVALAFTVVTLEAVFYKVI